jgi:hypothetical protein
MFYIFEYDFCNKKSYQNQLIIFYSTIKIKNYPLYIRTAIAPNQSAFSEENLKYWYTIHTSLDVIEEKIRKNDFKDLYLGLLYLIEDFRM